MSSFKRENTDSGEKGPNSKRVTKSGGEKISTPPSPEDSGEKGPNSKRGTKSGGEKISAPPFPEGKEISSQTGGGHCNCRTSIGFDDYNALGYRVGAPEIATSVKAWTPCSIHGGCITPAPSDVIDRKLLPSRGKIKQPSDYKWEESPVPKTISSKHRFIAKLP